MYKEINIKRLRCFTDFSIENLDRINLITGKNNVGKTALLEAIWLHHGSPNPELGIRLNRFRGIEGINVAEPLLELFHNLLIDTKIELSSKDSNGVSRSDKIYLKEPSRMKIRGEEAAALPKPASGSGVSIGKEIVIEFIDEHGKSGESVASFGLDEIRFGRPPIPSRSIARFLQANRGITAESTNLFSEMEIKGRKSEIVESLQLVEPNLKDVTVIIRGRDPEIWGEVDNKPLLPLQVMGDGLCRMLMLIMSIQASTDGVVLIDEIENGLHHTVMTDVWRVLSIQARKYNVQIFATTHSAECVQAAYTALSESEPFDFRLHRIEQVKQTVKAFSYDKDTLKTALETRLEFR